MDFPNTIVVQTKKIPGTQIYLHSLKGPKKTLNPFKTNLLTQKKGRGRADHLGVPGLQSAKDHLLLAPRLLHVDDWTMLLNPRCY